MLMEEQDVKVEEVEDGMNIGCVRRRLVFRWISQSPRCTRGREKIARRELSCNLGIVARVRMRARRTRHTEASYETQRPRKERIRKRERKVTARAQGSPGVDKIENWPMGGWNWDWAGDLKFPSAGERGEVEHNRHASKRFGRGFAKCTQWEDLGK